MKSISKLASLSVNGLGEVVSSMMAICILVLGMAAILREKIITFGSKQLIVKNVFIKKVMEE